MSYSLLAIAQAALASNVIIGKIVLTQLPTFVFLGIRFFISSVLLSIMMLFVNCKITADSHPIGNLQVKDCSFLFGQALTGGFLYNFLFYQGVQLTTATDAGIISSTLPAMIAVCAFFFLKEKLDRNKILAIILAILGIIVINLDYSNPDAQARDLLGNALILLAMVPEAFYSIFNKFISPRIHPVGGSVVVSWLVFLMMFPIMCLEWVEMDSSQVSIHVFFLSALGGFFSALFFVAWTLGLAKVSASRASIFGGVLPVVTAILGWYFLEESFTWYTITGITFVFASLGMAIKWRIKGKALLSMKMKEE